MAGSLNYRQALQELRLMSAGDAWADVMHVWFSVADEIHFNRPELDVPADWLFRPSPMGATNDPDDCTTRIVQELPDADLMRLGALADRCAHFLRYLELDY